MSANGQTIFNLMKSGKMSLEELRQILGDTSSGNVTVQEWGACYSDATGELSEYCTVTADNASDPITGIGLLVYSSNGSQMYCVQYTNYISSPSIATSVGTALFNPQDGDAILGVVYGTTESGNFFFSQPLKIVPC